MESTETGFYFEKGLARGTLEKRGGKLTAKK
jgi:hypothetical protein